MQNLKYKNTKFIHCDLKIKKNRNEVFRYLSQKKLNNKEIIIFFSDSFDTPSLKKILKDFKKFKKLYVVLVNVKNYNILEKDFKIVDKYFFKNRNRNILQKMDKNNIEILIPTFNEEKNITSFRGIA